MPAWLISGLQVLGGILVLAGLVWLVRHRYGRLEANSEITPGDRQLFNSYQSFLNEQVGLFSFTFALAALGTDSPKFYAFLSLGIVLIQWYRGARRYKTVVKIWSRRDHFFLSSWSVLVNFPVFLIGYVTLLLVLVGILEKGTLKDAMPF